MTNKIPIISQVFGPACAILFTLILVSRLSLHDFGNYSVALSYSFIVHGIFNLNTWQSYTRILKSSKNENASAYHNFYTRIEILNALLSSIIVVLLAWFFNFFSWWTVTYLCILTIAMYDGSQRTFLRVNGHYIFLLIAELLLWGARFIGLFLAIIFQMQTISNIILVFALTKLFHTFLLLLFCKNFVQSNEIKTLKIDQLWTYTLNYSSWSFLNGIQRIAVNHGLTVFAAYYFGSNIAGVHAFGMQLLKPFGVVTMALLQIRYSNISKILTFNDMVKSNFKMFVLIIATSSVLIIYMRPLLAVIKPELEYYSIILTLYLVTGMVSLMTFPIAPSLLDNARPELLFILNLISTSFGLICIFSLSNMLNFYTIGTALILYQLVFVTTGFGLLGKLKRSTEYPG